MRFASKEASTHPSTTIQVECGAGHESGRRRCEINRRVRGLSGLSKTTDRKAGSESKLPCRGHRVEKFAPRLEQRLAHNGGNYIAAKRLTFADVVLEEALSAHVELEPNILNGYQLRLDRLFHHNDSRRRSSCLFPFASLR